MNLPGNVKHSMKFKTIEQAISIDPILPRKRENLNRRKFHNNNNKKGAFKRLLHNVTLVSFTDEKEQFFKGLSLVSSI